MNEDKDRTKVIILSRHYRITGEISLLKGARLTDYIVGAKPFIAVTQADVMDHEGRPILTTSFLNVRRDYIEIMAPAELAKIDQTLQFMKE
jgi:hypothetical protein